MRNHAVLAITLVAAGALAAATWLKPSTETQPIEGLVSRAPASVSRAVSIPKGHGYSFTRSVDLTLGGKKSVELRIAGQFWPIPGGALIQIESPEALKNTPLVKIELTPAGATLYSAASSAIDGAFVSELGEDLARQFSFFEKRDRQGYYDARITKLSEGRFHKTKYRYLEEPYSEAVLQSSEHDLEYQKGTLVPAHIQGAEKLTLAGQGLSMQVEQAYRFIADSSAREPRVSAWTPVKITESAATELATLNLPALEMLVAQVRSGRFADGSARLRAFHQLSTRLKLKPESASTVTPMVQELKDRPKDLGIVIGALASVPNLSAQTALQEAFQDPAYPLKNKELILNAWITTPAELPDSALNFLESLAAGQSGAAQGAWLALGTQASRTNGDKKAKIENLLLERLKSASNERDRGTALDAIGNSGSPSFYPYVRDYLADPSAYVRSRAYLALRLMPGEEVTQTLTGGKKDPAPLVQHSIELALEMRDTD